MLAGQPSVPTLEFSAACDTLARPAFSHKRGKMLPKTE
jgi:hypothetical protein